MAMDVDQARQFVSSVDLSGTRRQIIHQDPTKETGEVFDKAKAQAQLVGSGVYSFAQGVTPEVREAISNSALLAQLVANKETSIEEDPVAWFSAYSKVLENVGWTLQDVGWTDYTTEGTAAEVHEQIIEVLKVALGPAPAALGIITASINALKNMQPDSSWMTIFSQESQKAKIGRFQIGFVDKEENGDVFVSLLGVLIEAQNDLTQVLFFKFKQANARFRANGTKISINRGALTDLGPAIRTKTRAYQLDYLSNIINLTVP